MTSITVNRNGISAYTYDTGGSGTISTTSGTWTSVGTARTIPVSAIGSLVGEWYMVGYAYNISVTAAPQAVGGYYTVGYPVTFTVKKTVIPSGDGGSSDEDNNDDTNWISENWPLLAIGGGVTGIVAIALISRSGSSGKRKRR